MLTALAIGAGLALLYVGGELLVRGSVALAARMGVPPLMIGITLVGFGTSMPELVTSVDAVLQNAPGIAIGNVVGSNIVNILLILGLGALVAPVGFAGRALSRDVSAVVLSAVIFVGLAAHGSIGRVSGLILCLLLVGYLVVAYYLERGSAAAAASPGASLVRPGRPWFNLAVAVAGIAVVILGADILVKGAIELARFFEVSDTVIGLTVVAIGTSLPELAATVSAAFRREGSIALGNVLGSCIFNVFGILGVAALVQPLIVPEEILRFDAWVLLATVLLLAFFAFTGRMLTRMEGTVFLAAYAVYVGYLVSAGG